MNVVAVVVAVLAVGCQKSEKPAPAAPPPTEALVTAMRDYCRIPTLAPERQKEALKMWGWQTASDKQVGPIWTAAVVKKSASAIAMIRAAADVGVGPGNCNQLNALTVAAP